MMVPYPEEAIRLAQQSIDEQLPKPPPEKLPGDDDPPLLQDPPVRWPPEPAEPNEEPAP